VVASFAKVNIIIFDGRRDYDVPNTKQEGKIRDSAKIPSAFNLTSVGVLLIALAHVLLFTGCRNHPKTNYEVTIPGATASHVLIGLQGLTGTL
jgi:hypothetical protein